MTGCMHALQRTKSACMHASMHRHALASCVHLEECHPCSSACCCRADMSTRLGTGKGGIRLAPEDVLLNVLQVRL